MSLFRYQVSLAGGERKEGKVTARTEKEARERLAKQHSIVEWISIKEEPSANPKPAVQSVKVKPLSKLQKMLYLQGGRCFFCGKELTEGEASIEHLNPRASGGRSAEENVVVCHATLNQTFGSMDLKRKFEFVLRSAGSFKCPGVK